ncbi:MAG: hypothetical protein KJO70_02520 [Gammaproteobacteria bacterium]|nr:hypothetical protein [Gammaproteobacteria bacterium]
MVISFLLAASIPISGKAATVVPPEVQQPGTQPGEVSLESSGRCHNCHSNFNDAASSAAGEGTPQDEPSTGWMGAPMALASRDPIFWATMAIAEQSFDGSGDLCLRCHTTGGWYGGNSTPTDGSGLAFDDSEGVDCDTCHKMTRPDGSEHTGVMIEPFLANCSADPLVPLKQCDDPNEAFFGSGMLSLSAASGKLGPYSQTVARHGYEGSAFHRDVDFCGSCHDVSNPVIGDLAPGNGVQPGAPAPVSSADYNGGTPNVGGPVSEKAAFNNPPYTYGVVERTFSEYKASAFPVTRVAEFSNLPEELRAPGGSIEKTWQAAQLAGTGGDYADGAPRFFSCQSCHMRPVNSAGCDKQDAEVRPDLPRHDHMGGNYWLADVIRYQDSQGTLRFGGGLAAEQETAMDFARQRAIDHLQQAAALEINGDELKVINLTGHKLITGYPEGRRMWLEITWFDANNEVLRVDGEYGPLKNADGTPVTVNSPASGQPVQVESILNLDDPHTLIYEAGLAITAEWANRLLALGWPGSMPLAYDRKTGEVTRTLAQLAAASPGSYQKSFHFVLNNTVISDNRIPPYGMRYDEALRRNALPVPASLYGDPGALGIYDHYDEIDLNDMSPSGTARAEIALRYQGTSWEYIQFLTLANNGTDPGNGGNAFLGNEGGNLLEAWLHAEIPLADSVAGDRRMVPPVTMATATWIAEIQDEIVFKDGFEQQ